MKRFAVGDLVLFGRDSGEKTLGKIKKVNPTRYKVEQLESRGTFRTYRVGTIWTVPEELMVPAPGQSAATPVVEPPVAPWAPFHQKKPEVKTLNFKVGDVVTFRGPYSTQIVATVEKVNVATLKAKEASGKTWRVHPALCTPHTGVAPVAAPKRDVKDIYHDILSCYAALSPENLYCDGECSRAQAMARGRTIKARLKALETEMGRKISEDEAYSVCQKGF